MLYLQAGSKARDTIIIILLSCTIKKFYISKTREICKKFSLYLLAFLSFQSSCNRRTQPLHILYFRCSSLICYTIPNLLAFNISFLYCCAKDHFHFLLQPGTAAPAKLLVISGGDGYEDFRSSGMSELAGRDDSTNHLLLWQV